MYKYIPLLIFLFLHHLGKAQFQKSTFLESRIATHINNNGEIIHGTRTNEQESIISKFNIKGLLTWSKKILAFDDNGVKRLIDFRATSQLLENGDFIFSDVFESKDTKILVSKMNSNGNIDFTKLLKFPEEFIPTYDASKRYVPHTIDFESKSFIVMSYLSNSKESESYYSFVKFNTQGDLLWHKEFKDQLPDNPIRFINKIGSNHLALIRNNFFHHNGKENNGDIVQILNENFQTTKTLLLNKNIQKVIYKKDRYYIFTKRDNFESLHSAHPNSIICLDSEFRILWAKEYVIEADRPTTLTFSETSYGFILSEYIDYHTNVNLIAIDLNGELISNKVIAANSKYSHAPSTSNTHIVLETKFKNELGSQVQLNCIPNTLDDFECYTAKNCISIFDFAGEVNETNDFFLEPISLNIVVDDVILETENYTPDYLDYCHQDFTDFPIPFFDIPDSVCLNENISIFNLQNKNAETVDWFLPNSSIQFSSLSSPPAFSYPTAGTFTITQQVTFEGCTNEYSRDIVVIAPIDLAVETDIILCDTDPYLIDASHNLALAHLWQDSTTNPTLLIDDRGIYIVAITDKYCTQTIDFNANYFDYSTIDPLLNEDSLICLQQPLTIGQELDPAVHLYWSDEHTSYPRRVSSPGVYTLTTSLGECSTESSVFIDVEDCTTRIFMPNIFSPNKDGINEQIYPFGNDFQILQFSIYDKWGMIIHDSLTPWDGTFRNKESNSGTYTYSIKLLNLRLDTVESLSGTFTLVR